MYKNNNIASPFIILPVSFLLIVLIGVADYYTGPELSFSIFYLIPLSVLSLYRHAGVSSVIIGSIFATLCWFIAEFITREYSSIFFPVWNAFVRLTIFSMIGLLMLYLKNKQKKLNSINKELKLLNEEKNKFIGVAAHDLRTPIGGIFSFSDLLLKDHKDQIPSEAYEYAAYIRTLSNNALIILKNLLDISTIESGKIELNLKSQDYVAFVKQRISLNHLSARPKNIVIRFDPRMEHIYTEFDSNYLGEVIDNLLSNAIKYSYHNSMITLGISVSDPHVLLTEVIDNGIGIPQEEQSRLFNYFQTTSIKPIDGELSTGLGLAISKQIVVLHKGEMGVKSIHNQGSNFYFTLPVKNPVSLANMALG